MEVKEVAVSISVEVSGSGILEGEKNRDANPSVKSELVLEGPAGKLCDCSQVLNGDTVRTLVLLIPGQSHSLVVIMASS